MKLPVERLKDVAEAFHYLISRDWWGKYFADLEASGVRLDGELWEVACEDSLAPDDTVTVQAIVAH